jgi:uncharacterized protein YkwD
MSFIGNRQIRKTVVAAAVSIGALGAVAATFVVSSPAFASSSASGALVSATNSSRSAAGLAALTESSQLDAVAQGWANKLAASQVLAHNPNLESQITGWTTIGENVGMGADVPTLEQAFMASPAHKANILNTAFTQVGVGTASSIDPSCKCAILWVVVDFRRPTSVAAAKTTPVKTAPVKPAPAKTAPVKTTPATVKPSPVVVPTHAAVAVTPAAVVPATPIAKAAEAKPSAVVVSSPVALQAQIAQVDAASGPGADPVASVLDFASVLAAIS